MSRWAVDMETQPVCCLHKIQPQITKTASSVELSVAALPRESHLPVCTGTWAAGGAWRRVVDGLNRSRAAGPPVRKGLLVKKVRGSPQLLRFLWCLFSLFALRLPFVPPLVFINKTLFSWLWSFLSTVSSVAIFLCCTGKVKLEICWRWNHDILSSFLDKCRTETTVFSLGSLVWELLLFMHTCSATLLFQGH